jgi:tRNA threonylcarbamoyladenosine biosynthesis protein TsaB
MNLTLAIDCSLRWLNLGLADADNLYGEENSNSGRSQAELLPDAVQRFLSSHGFALGDLERIAVTTGPGYYTGIRVGLSYAAALAEGLGIKVVPVTSLYALAYPLLISDLSIAPVLKARKGCVYGAVYPAAGGEGRLEPAFYSVSAFADKLHSLSYGCGGLVLAGPDTEIFDELKDAGYRMITVPPATGLSLARASFTLPETDPANVRAAYTRGLD